MAHLARLNNDNVVLAVHCVNNNELLDNGVESEQKGIDFLTSLHGHTNWKQTSYNGNIRKNYAGIGYTYDATRDAFIPPQPYQSWVLDESTCHWTALIPMPTDGQYTWDEMSLNWKLLEVI